MLETTALGILYPVFFLFFFFFFFLIQFSLTDCTIKAKEPVYPTILPIAIEEEEMDTAFKLLHT